ncbi:MAG TPA: hypothetical protein VFP65_16895 [Anaeromyxobacteraceae bacterium]|nr:hypothetical protein [Anaeromyxobacteraceae bacterium]
MPVRRILTTLALLTSLACGGASSPGGGTPPPTGGTPPPTGGTPPPTTTPPTTTPPGTKSGIAMPTELSALPPRSGGGLATAAFRALATRAIAPAGSDYAAAVGVKSVDERALAQFDIFNTIFRALADTHYADPGNVDAGPYLALVRWENPNDDSKAGKQLMPWTVDSRMEVDGSGAEVNAVDVWMADPSPDAAAGVEIAIAFRIHAAPTRRADGTYADYGVWTIAARSNEPSPLSFAASASRDASGASIVTVHQTEDGGQREVAGILQRAEGAGHGKVSFPDWSSCDSPDCLPTTAQAVYAYDAASVVLAKDGAAPVYKDRTRVVDLVGTYGLFDADTFEDVARTHVFGFGVEAALADGSRQYGYYGAWQGRHQLWTNGQQSMPAGVQVVRSDRDRSASAPVTYTTSRAYVGVLVKRTPVPSSLAEIRDVVLQGYESTQMTLTLTQAGWTYCRDPGPWIDGTPTCTARGDFSDFAGLVADPTGRRQVWIGGPSQPGSPPVSLTCDGQGNFRDQGTGAAYLPTVGTQLWVSVGGPVYVVSTAGGWIQKQVAQWLENAPLPLFDDAQDRSFLFQPGREYYLSDRGTNYIVKTADGAAFSVLIERQTAANPGNAPAFVPADTVFEQQWAGAGASTYRFVTDPASPSYLQLVYATVGTGDAASGAQVGDVVRSGQWGLVASTSSEQFNWEYPRPGEGWGVQQFLLDANGEYVILDEPIRFAPEKLTNVDGVTRTYALQYDGSWVSGLPDVWNDLRANGYQMTADIAGEAVVIPDGFEVADAVADPVTGVPRRYVFKALRTSEYLMPLEAPPPGLDGDLAAADALDLSQIPPFTDPAIGPRPDAALRYVEGKAVP